MIDRFIAQVKTRNFARTNRFNVYIGFPPGSTLGNMIELSSLYCEAVPLPGINIATQQHKPFGESYDIPYEPIYDPVAITFLVDSDLLIRTAFETWLSKIVDPVSRTFGYYDDYKSTVEIELYNVDDSSPYRMTLYEAYPKNIGQVRLDNNDRSIMKMDVGFAYKYWRSDTP